MTGNDTQQVFERVRAGDEEAAREIFERYITRLVALARSRLSEKMTGKLDADDVVQSAFRSFFIRAREGQYVIDRAGDLWRLLASITRRKLLSRAEHFRQKKRSLDRDQPLSVKVMDEASCSEEPSFEEAVALADEVEFLMRDLPPRQRTMLELRLQGQPIPQIAETVERSERTVRRFLGVFREQLEERLQSLVAD